MTNLTKQQKIIVELLAEGYNNAEIADELSISLKTVKNHVYLLLKRLGARNRTEVVVYYYKDLIKELKEELNSGT